MTVTIPGKPIPQGRPRVTRYGTYYPKSTKAYRKLLTETFKEAWSGPPIKGPAMLTIYAYGIRKGGDLSNVQKAVEDSLVDAGVLAGDDWERLCETHAYGRRADKESPRLVVTIESL